jgi:DNA-binding response OmpR family regulator
MCKAWGATETDGDRPVNADRQTGSLFPVEHLPRLVLLEPEPLLRWSLTEYLGRWFQVCTAEDPAAVLRLLEQEPVDALILSDATPLDARRRLQVALHSHPVGRVLYTVADPTSVNGTPERVIVIEKPFRLAEVAHLLGVGAAV